MQTEKIEIEHNRIVTVIFCLLNLIAVAALSGCVALLWVNKAMQSVGQAFIIAATVLLSLCALWLLVLLINQLCKFRRKIIFVADDYGIYDYSRHIVLAPIAWNEIADIEYKELLSDDVSDLRHIKIKLKPACNYPKKLNALQKVSYFLGLKHIELHLFSGKIKLKELAEKLKRNLEAFKENN